MKTKVKNIRIYPKMVNICFRDRDDAKGLSKEEGWNSDGLYPECISSAEDKNNYHINITGNVNNIEFGGTEARSGVFVDKWFDCSLKKVDESSYHNAIYCSKNGKKPNILWRYGNPVIRECMDENYPRRGSGHYGCGLYAFRDTPLTISKKYVEIDVSTMKFYYPETSQELKDVVKIAKEMNKVSRRYDPYKSELDKLRKNDIIPEWDIEIEGLDISEDDIVEAIGKARDCLENEEISDKFHCSPPINHLLFEKGIDGIIPLSAEGNQFNNGSVIFREAVESIIGKTITKHEEFDLK